MHNWLIYISSTYGSGTYNTSSYSSTQGTTAPIIVGPITIPASGPVIIGTTTLPVTGPTFLFIVAAIIFAMAAGIAWWVIERR